MADQAPAAAPSAPTTATTAAPTDGSTPQSAAPAGAQVPVTPEAATEQIDAIDDWATLEATLDGANAAASTPTAAPEATASTTAPDARVPEGSAQPPAAPAPEVVPDGEQDDTDVTLPKNFRFHTENPQLASYLLILKREPGVNPIEAARRAGFTDPSAAVQQAAAQPAAAPAAPQPDPLQPIRDEIATLRQQKKEAREKYEFDKVDELQDQILEATLKLDRQERELAESSQAEAGYQSDYTAARQQAATRHPATVTPGTPQHEEVAREVAYLESTDPTFFDDPSYPVKVLERLETRRPDLFPKSAAAPAAAQVQRPVTPPPNAQPPRLPARPVGEIVPGNNGQPAPLTAAAATAEIENLDMEQLEKLGNAVGTPAGRGAALRR